MGLGSTEASGGGGCSSCWLNSAPSRPVLSPAIGRLSSVQSAHRWRPRRPSRPSRFWLSARRRSDRAVVVVVAGWLAGWILPSIRRRSGYGERLEGGSGWLAGCRAGGNRWSDQLVPSACRQQDRIGSRTRAASRRPREVPSQVGLETELPFAAIIEKAASWQLVPQILLRARQADVAS